ncbi:PQQ-binding-like beta-propeller repeat protein [Winogradskyella sp. 3972H.M.0a.05]|uniref:outer membrane protein assembly factor BamB family protein n=1 Tax=Winogradskyella sp. 3972H.M.0a.05 TaxID=2950277 RepID=UPI00339AAA64
MKTLLIHSSKYVTMLVLFLSATSLLAQKAETPDNSYALGAKINDMTITEGGTVVVATNDGLVGIKPNNSNLLFNFTDYGKVKPEELNFIPNAPYVVVGQTGFGGLRTKSAVIDYMSGQTLFSTEKNGWKAIGVCEVLMPQNKLVVSGQRRAKEQYAQAVAVYDLGTGDQLSFVKMKGSQQAMGTPLMLSDGLIIPTTKGLIKVDMNSGNVVWKNDIKNVGWMVTDESEKEIYAFAKTANLKNTRIYKINANGSPAWADERKVKGGVSNFQILPQGLAVVSDVADSGKKGLGKLTAARAESKITMFSAATGDDLWEKAPKTKGYVQHFYIVEDGILFGIREGGINKVSFDGKPLFKKPLKTGENIHTMALTKQGLIYITDTDANIINLSNGESIWSKPIKYKRAKSVTSAYDSGHGRYLISTGAEIIAIDENNGEVSTLASFKFQEKENPTAMSIRDNGILLSSSQNMMMLNFDGSEQFNEYYRSPGKSAFGSILMGALAVASTAMATSAAARAGANRNALGQYNSYGAQMKRTQDMFTAIGTASFKELAKRFKASSATKDAQFILTKLDSGVGLVKLNKDTGSMEKEIVLKDKKPVYKVDEFGGYLYYKSGDKTVFAYDLNK